MELPEERRLVQAIFDYDSVIGAYAGILGETGLRMEEGLRLKWNFVNLDREMLTVEASKNYKARHVPLSAFAIQLFRTLPRIEDLPYCFPNSKTGNRWKDPRVPLHNARTELKMDWVRGWHDFRHFRATQWIMDGVDVEAVRGLLGHKDISTTMKYVHYVAEHAKDSVRRAEQRELARLRASQERAKQATNRQRDSAGFKSVEDLKSITGSLSMPEGGLEPPRGVNPGRF
jgi:integrase